MHFIEDKPTSSDLIVRSPYPDIEIPEKTFTQLIWERQEKWKNHIALVCGVSGEEYTYGELKRNSQLVGQALLNQGLRSGDVVAVLLPNSPQYISLILGVPDTGMTLCSINTLYTADEINYQLTLCKAKCIVTCLEKLDSVIEAIDAIRSSRKLPENFKIFSTRLNSASQPLPPGVISFDDLMTKSIKCRSDECRVSPYSVAFIAHSSGTTGLPKGVCLTHRNIAASILQMAVKPMSVFKETTDVYQDVIPMVLPLFHNFGLEIILDSFYHGSKIITLPRFEESTFLSTLKNYKATMLFAVPPTLLYLSTKDSVTPDYLQNLRCIVTAAAPISNEDIKRFLNKVPKEASFINAYGQTEAVCCLTHVPYGCRNYKSIGVPMVNTLIKIVDLETGLPKKANEEGELCFKGPQTTIGYLNNPEANNEAFDSNGWFHTGDIGYYDKDSFFYIVDRIKEMIKVKGYQVAPAELESVLRSYPQVKDAGVIGVSDKRKGEVPIGFIEVEKGANIDEEKLKAFLSSKVASFKVIDRFIQLDAIPRSASGKILRRNLKKLYHSYYEH